MTTRFILVRHGETPSSRERRFAGATDVELTDEGRAHARLVAQRLRQVRIDVLHVSPLVRCLQTAEPITDVTGRKPTVVEDIRECHFGAWENLTLQEILENHGDGIQHWLQDDTVCPPGGESWTDLGKRVTAWFEEAGKRYAGRTVLAVTHGGPILWLGRHLTGGARAAMGSLFVEPTSISMITSGDGRTRIRLWNDTTHIRDPLLDGST